MRENCGECRYFHPTDEDKGYCNFDRIIFYKQNEKPCRRFELPSYESGREITLTEAIEIMEAQGGELGLVTGVWLFSDDIVEYLKQYKELREQERHG